MKSVLARLASRLGVLILSAAAFLASGAINDARAVCTTMGTVVVCTGSTPAGFGNGTQDGLTITVQPGATVGSTGAANPAIDINDNNILTNLGTITAGVGWPGVSINNGNRLTNTGTITVGDAGAGIAAFGTGNIAVNNGLISIGNDGAGISILDASTATNFGTITVGNATGLPTYGMGIGSGCGCLADNSSLFNYGTIRVGDDAVGLFAEGDFNTLTNFGTIAVGNGPFGSAAGLVAIGVDNTLINAGTITAGTDAGGISSLGTGARITNSGTIRVGDSAVGFSYGIASSGSGAEILNSGVISVGSGVAGPAFGILAVGNNLRITNSGMISVGDDGVGIAANTGGTGSVVNSGTIRVGNTVGGQAAGIAFAAGGTGHTVANSGSIIVGDAGQGIIFQADASTATNSGLIMGGAGSVGILVDGAGNTVLNSGSIFVGENGTGIQISTGGHGLTNSGLIAFGSCGRGIDAATAGNTVTNSGRIVGTGCGGQAVVLGNNGLFTNSGTVSVPDLGVGNDFSVLADGGATGIVVANSGTLDGPIDLRGAGGNSLTNSGLITNTSPWLGISSAHMIDGTYTQSASGTLAMRIDAAGVYDVFQTTGVTTLAGTMKALVQPGLYGAVTTYPFIVAGGDFVGTRFDRIVSTSPFFIASGSYTANTFDLVLTRIPFNQVPNLSGNATAVGAALEAGYSTSLTGPAATAYGLLLASTAPNTLQQLTGEVGTAGQNASFAIFGQFLGASFGQTSSTRDGSPSSGAASAPGRGTRMALTAGGGTRVSFDAAEECLAPSAAADACVGRQSTSLRWSLWTQVFGAKGNVNADATTGSAAVTSTTTGAATGVDVQLTPDLLVGFTAGGTGASYTLDGAGSGSARSVTLGLYGGYQMGSAYLDAALGYGRGSFNTQRIVNTGTIAEQITGNFEGDLFGGKVETGYRFAVDRHVLTPFAGFAVQTLRQNGYSETSRDLGNNGPGVFGLTVRSQTTTSVRSTLGAQISTTFDLDERTRVTPRLKLGWAHEFNTDRVMNASFSVLAPNQAFTVGGVRPAADSAVVSAGVDFDIGSMVRLFAQFDGDFSANARSWSGTGGIRLNF